MNLYLGIDPGVSGALAVIHPEGVELFDVPTRKGTTGEKYLPGDMADLLRPYAGNGSYVVIEEARPPMVARDKGSGNISAAFKIGQGVGLWEGILVAISVPYEVVPAATWKREFRLTGQDKKASRARAQELFPLIRADLGKKRPDFSEALLLAEWGRRRQSGGAK